jgi:hypothetical protein
MLREWVRNLPLATLQAIVADTDACYHVVWRLAYAELARRVSRATLETVGRQ